MLSDYRNASRLVAARLALGLGVPLALAFATTRPVVSAPSPSVPDTTHALTSTQADPLASSLSPFGR